MKIPYKKKIYGQSGGRREWDEWRKWHRHIYTLKGFPGGSDGKESTCNVRDLGLIPGWGRFSGKEHGNPLILPQPVYTLLLLLSRFSCVRLCATP